MIANVYSTCGLSSSNVISTTTDNARNFKKAFEVYGNIKSVDTS